MTRPFPSYRPVREPSWDFVWNRWLSIGFRHLGLDFLCPPMLQASGAAERGGGGGVGGGAGAAGMPGRDDEVELGGGGRHRARGARASQGRVGGGCSRLAQPPAHHLDLTWWHVT